MGVPNHVEPVLRGLRRPSRGRLRPGAPRHESKNTNQSCRHHRAGCVFYSCVLLLHSDSRPNGIGLPASRVVVNTSPPPGQQATLRALALSPRGRESATGAFTSQSGKGAPRFAGGGEGGASPGEHIGRGRREKPRTGQRYARFAPNYRATRAFSAKKPDRLSSIIAKLVNFRPKSPITYRPFCHSTLCFHAHSRVDLHF